MGWNFVCHGAVCLKSNFLNKTKMRYEVFLVNGSNPWLAFSTTDETQANEYVESVKQKVLFVYLRVLDERGRFVSIRCFSK